MSHHHLRTVTVKPRDNQGGSVSVERELINLTRRAETNPKSHTCQCCCGETQPQNLLVAQVVTLGLINDGLESMFRVKPVDGVRVKWVWTVMAIFSEILPNFDEMS